MTIFEHGLYGGAIAYSVNPDLFWLGIAFGMMPDIPPGLIILYKIGPKRFIHGVLRGGSENYEDYIYKIYDTMHSFVTAFVLLILLFLIQGSLTILAACYAFHILCDIPLHQGRFATKFLFPITSFHFKGVSYEKYKMVALAQYPIIFVIYVFLFWK